MADGISATLADDFLALALNGTTYAGNTQVYVQLHVGAPGSAGTTNIASNSTRQSCGASAGFTAPSAGSTTNVNAVTWTSVPTAETYSHVSIWSAASAGTFLYSGSITANAVAVGDTFTIPAGDITISQTVAS